MNMNNTSPESQIKHVAVIMDGNGRWAKARSHQRVWGHIRGSGVVSKIVEEADDLGIKALTLYAFSTENWSRPVGEVTTLFKLLKKFLLKEKSKILSNKIQFKVIGEIKELPKATIELIKSLEEETRNFTGLKLTFAFGYGGQSEILSSVNSFIKKNPGKEISIDDVAQGLFRPEIGDVDLLIRTGGEQRISNFLLWQIAYAELFFTPTPWPDFSPKEFRKIIEVVRERERRFGDVSASNGLIPSFLKGEKNKLAIRGGARME
jgi:undecaprenyl diphosphate synthase